MNIREIVDFLHGRAGLHHANRNYDMAINYRMVAGDIERNAPSADRPLTHTPVIAQSPYDEIADACRDLYRSLSIKSVAHAYNFRMALYALWEAHRNPSLRQQGGHEAAFGTAERTAAGRPAPNLAILRLHLWAGQAHGFGYPGLAKLLMLIADQMAEGGRIIKLSSSVLCIDNEQSVSRAPDPTPSPPKVDSELMAQLRNMLPAVRHHLGHNAWVSCKQILDEVEDK